MHRNSYALIVGSIVVLLSHFAGVAPAGIILSGDSNIANALDGSNFAPGIDPGNRRFFQNILGSGHTVRIHNEIDPVYSSQGPGIYNAMNNFYNGLPAVSSALFSGTITAATLVGVDLFIEMSPNRAIAAGEISALSSFANSPGKTLVFIGENTNFPVSNANINNAPSALGAGMSILNQDFDQGYFTATGAQITSDALTSGVTTLTYAGPTSISGGNVLFRGKGNEPFIAYIPEPASASIAGVMGMLAAMRTRRR